jgi:hypothetical protein
MKKIFSNPYVIGGLVISALLIVWYLIYGKKTAYSEWALMRYVTTEAGNGPNHLPTGHRLYDSTGFRVGTEMPKFKAGDTVSVVPESGEAITATVLDVFMEPRANKPKEYWVATTVRTTQLGTTEKGTIAAK